MSMNSTGCSWCCFWLASTISPDSSQATLCFASMRLKASIQWWAQAGVCNSARPLFGLACITSSFPTTQTGSFDLWSSCSQFWLYWRQWSLSSHRNGSMLNSSTNSALRCLIIWAASIISDSSRRSELSRQTPMRIRMLPTLERSSYRKARRKKRRE